MQQKSTRFAKAEKPRRKVLTQPQIDKLQADQIHVQNKLLALGLFLPSLRPYLDPITTDMMHEPVAKKMLQILKTQPDFTYEELVGSSDEPLLSLQEYGRILSLVFDELYKDLEVLELRYEAARMQIRKIETYVKTQKARLARAMQTANDADMERLLEAAKRLDVLLKSAKETTK